VLHTLYYPAELHKGHKGESSQAKYSAKELELARNLVSQLSAPFKPSQFEDTYRENVKRLIQQKQKGQNITTVTQPPKAPAMDLMEALKRSLNASRAAAKSAPKAAHAKKASKQRKAA
jgi:DNA end-binding protein Ku